MPTATRSPANSCTPTRRCSPARRSTTAGKHIRLEGGQLLFPPVQAPHPPLYFGGSSEEGIDVAAETVDKYLTWGEPPALVAEKIAKVKRGRRASTGRTLSFGIRLHVIVRETSEEAWAAADRLIAHLDDETIAKAQSVFARMDSVGQSRMSALHGGRRDKLVVSPNLWAGVGLVRGGAGTALVGSPEEVAARMEEYRSIGIDTFILSGYPHLEEAYRFAELVFPLLPLGHAPERTDAFGQHRPVRRDDCQRDPAGREKGILTMAGRIAASRAGAATALAAGVLGAADRSGARLGDRLAQRAGCRPACCRRRARSPSPSGRTSATARCSPMPRSRPNGR